MRLQIMRFHADMRFMRFGCPHMRYAFQICMIAMRFHSDMCLYKHIYFPNPPEVRFVHAVNAGGSVKFLPAV